MNPERWEQIKQVYQAALEVEPGRREEFLKEACAGDESLFKEVTSLLAQEENSQGLFEAPALDVVARALAEDEVHKPQQNLTGHTLLHYRIEKKIGQGGMGEVFLAQDTSLNRKVAMKFLPPEMQQDPVAHKRFLGEARSAAALDNPYICSIHEVGEFEGKDFIVMEYVDGQTLTEKLRRGRLPVNQALQIATEVAEALQTAHGKGIIHRDLKPSNIMLTKTGHAKVMDFGLAKQIVPSGGIESQEESVSTMTRSGMTLGTLAYMSPEQVRGEAVDARSDIFSFGLVLYEMLTGAHPFRKESPMETASAILHEEPKPVGTITPAIPADLEKLINRCLRKETERRIQHMDDVKLTMEETKADLDSGRLQVATPAPKRVSLLRLAAALVALVFLIAAGWYWLTRQRPADPEVPLIINPLTSYPGYEDVPSFSPDGNFVAFEWCPQGPGANCDIYIKQIGVEPPSRLTNDPAKDFSPAWSPDGRFIAFLREFSPNRSALMIVPQRGGQEKVIAELDISQTGALSGPYLSWTPDSKWLALPYPEAEKPARGLFLISADTGDKRRMTAPPPDGDAVPAFSPDGRMLAFQRQRPPRSDLYLLHLAEDYGPKGEPERIASGRPRCFGVAWLPEGSEIVCSLGRGFSTGSVSALWRIGTSTPARSLRLELPTDNARSPAISRKGNRLAYAVDKFDANIWRVDLKSPGRSPSTPVQLISSTQADVHPAYSPDGKRVVFASTRSGTQEIWVCNSDGTNLVQLTSFGDETGTYAMGPRWSPDGKRIVFAAQSKGNQDLYIVNINGGAPRRLTTDPASDKWPCWSRDGQSLYFVSDRSGWFEIWKMPVAGGEAVQITPNGEIRDVPQESYDGRFIYYHKGYPSTCSVWRMPVAGGQETKVLDHVHCYAGWAVWQQGIYFFTQIEEGGRNNICYYEFATGKTSEVLAVERQVDNHIATSPDGQTLLYTQLDQAGSDLMLVENFR